MHFDCSISIRLRVRVEVTPCGKHDTFRDLFRRLDRLVVAIFYCRETNLYPRSAGAPRWALQSPRPTRRRKIRRTLRSPYCFVAHRPPGSSALSLESKGAKSLASAIALGKKARKSGRGIAPQLIPLECSNSPKLTPAAGFRRIESRAFDLPLLAAGARGNAGRSVDHRSVHQPPYLPV